MGVRNLSVPILHYKCACAVQHARPANFGIREARCMHAAGYSAATRFHADQIHRCIRLESVEEPDGVAAAAHASDAQVRQAARSLQNLAAGFNANDALEIAHHARVRMRPQGRSEHVMRGPHVGDPVTDGCVDGVL